MAGGVLSLTTYTAGLGIGDPTEVVFSANDSGPAGVEAKLEYSGMFLNVRTWLETYVITGIDGLHDADIRDSRQDNPSADGETAFNSYYGGRTIVLTGFIRARSIGKLRDMQQALRIGFSDITQEKPLIFHAIDPAKSLMIYCKKHQPMTMPEAQNNFQLNRDFQISLRASNFRFLSVLPETAQITPNGSVVIVKNYGSYKAEPLITLANAMTNPIIKNNTTGQTIKLVGTMVAGESIQVDIAKHRVVDQTGARRFSMVTFDSDWPTLVPGDNVMEVTATSPSGAALVTLDYRHTFL